MAYSVPQKAFCYLPGDNSYVHGRNIPSKLIIGNNKFTKYIYDTSGHTNISGFKIILQNGEEIKKISLYNPSQRSAEITLQPNCEYCSNPNFTKCDEIVKDVITIKGNYTQDDYDFFNVDSATILNNVKY